MTATTEFVVPRSIPMILPIQISSLLQCVQKLFSPVPLSKFSLLLSSFIAVALAQTSAPSPKELLIAAAADLIAVQRPLEDAWLQQSDLRLRFTFGASGMLAQQIAAGAPYDLFLSADEARVKELAASGALIKDSVVRYAYGRLALWSKGGRAGSLSDLLSAAILHIAIANATHAPYGAAARQALEKSGLWTQLAAKIVYGESVRQAMQYVESGNVEAAIVAWPLVSDRGGGPPPPRLHDPTPPTASHLHTNHNTPPGPPRPSYP